MPYLCGFSAIMALNAPLSYKKESSGFCLFPSAFILTVIGGFSWNKTDFIYCLFPSCVFEVG